MPVLFESGKHNIVPPPGAGKIMGDKLRKAGFPLEFEWTLRPRTKIKGTSHTARFKATGWDTHRRSVKVRIQPGNNDTAWAYDLVVPNGIPIKQVFDDLRALTERVCDVVKAEPKKSAPSPSAPIIASPATKPVELKKEETVIVTQVVEKTTPPVTHRANLKGFSKDETSVGLVLLALLAAADSSGDVGIDVVREIFHREISGISVFSIGQLLSSLENREFLELRRHNRNLQSVKVTQRGKAFAEGTEVPPPSAVVVQVPSPSPSVVTPVDELLASVEHQLVETERLVGELRERLVSEEHKLEAFRAKREKLTAAREILKDL